MPASSTSGSRRFQHAGPGTGPGAGELLLEIEGLSKAFDGRPVLRDIHLAVHRGQVTALVAGNGQGKSTLLDLVSGVLEPDAGRIRVAGHDVTNARSDRRGVFYVPQSVKRYFAMKHPDLYCYLPGVTVRENVLGDLGGNPYAQAAAAEQRLARFGLSDAADALPAELSVGMQQRLALARALSVHHDVLLLDEPLASVDRVTRLRLLAELSQESAGRAVVYVTHDPTEVEALGAAPIELRDGILHDPEGRPLVGAYGYSPPPIHRPAARVEQLPRSGSGPRLAFGAATAAMGLGGESAPARPRRPEPVSFAQAAMPAAAPTPAAPPPRAAANRLGAPAGPPPGAPSRIAAMEQGIPFAEPVASTPKPAQATPGEGAISLGVSLRKDPSPPMVTDGPAWAGGSEPARRPFTDSVASWGQPAAPAPAPDRKTYLAPATRRERGGPASPPAPRPAPQQASARPAPKPAAPSRKPYLAPATRADRGATPEPGARPQPAPQARPQPAPQARPQPAPQARPQPAPHARPQPAPPARPAPRPQPVAAPAPARVPSNGSGRPMTPEAIGAASPIPLPGPGKALKSLLYGVAGSALRGVLRPRGGLPSLVQLLEDLASSLEEEAGRLRRR